LAIGQPLVLLADTTVLYSALAYRRLEHRALMSGRHVFVTTEFTTAEVFRILTVKRSLSRTEALDLIESMPVLIAGRDFLEERWNEADRLIGWRDRSDVPLVSLALVLEGRHDGIWSTDNDFEVIKGRFKVWRTRELLKA